MRNEEEVLGIRRPEALIEGGLRAGSLTDTDVCTDLASIKKGDNMKYSTEPGGPVSPDGSSKRLFNALRVKRRPSHQDFLDGRIEHIVSEAEFTRGVLESIRDLGPQVTWLGSRTLAETTQEYKWFFESARLLALIGFYQKTGKGGGLMAAPHHACHAIHRPDLVIGAAAGWLSDTEADHPYIVGGHIYQMPNFNMRHDVLFHGSDLMVVGAGRLGTWHEVYDLLNRLKHSLLADVPVYLVERDGYFSRKWSFSTNHINKVLGPRVTKDDFEKARIIDIRETTPAQFVAMVLRDLGCVQMARGIPELKEAIDASKASNRRRGKRTGGR